MKVINNNSRSKNPNIKTIYPSASANNAFDSKNNIGNNLMLNSHYGGGSNNFFFSTINNELKGIKIY